MAKRRNSVESLKSSKWWNPLRVRDDLPEMIAAPGRFMMRIRMPNGFATSVQLRAIADLSRRLGNSALDITTRQPRRWSSS